jgi:hypothetical protein
MQGGEARRRMQDGNCRQSSELQAKARQKHKPIEMMVRESWVRTETAASARTHAWTGVAASAPASACARRQQLALLQAERDSAWAIGGVVESRPRPEPLTDPALLVLASLVATPAGIARPAFPLQSHPAGGHLIVVVAMH